MSKDRGGRLWLRGRRRRVRAQELGVGVSNFPSPYLALDRTIDHDQARARAKQIAQRLAATAPDRYTISSAPDKRPGRIFIDYLRNGRDTTAISA